MEQQDVNYADPSAKGMNQSPLCTNAKPGDGEWIDGCGVKYNADRKKLILAPDDLSGK